MLLNKWNCPDNEFEDFPSVGIVWTIDTLCFLKIVIVETNDLGGGQLIGIVLTNDFTGCLLIGIKFISGDTWIGPIFRNVRKVGFGSDLQINWNISDSRVLQGSVIWKLAATLLVELQLIRSVHYKTTLLIVLPLPQDREVPSTPYNSLLRRTIWNRTYGIHKNLYIYLNLLTIFGRITMVPLAGCFTLPFVTRILDLIRSIQKGGSIRK